MSTYSTGCAIPSNTIVTFPPLKPCGTVTVIEVVVISLTVTGTDIPSKVTVTEFLSVPKPFPVNVISCPAFTNVP